MLPIKAGPEFAGRQMKAYKPAMTAWQDDYHVGVGKARGQARLWPGRRRTTTPAADAAPMRPPAGPLLKILDGLALCLSESLGSSNIQVYFREIRADAAGIPCQTGITYTTQIELDEMKGAVEMANEEICPFCGGEIVNGAIVCRGCGANKRTE